MKIFISIVLLLSLLIACGPSASEQPVDSTKESEARRSEIKGDEDKADPMKGSLQSSEEEPAYDRLPPPHSPEKEDKGDPMKDFLKSSEEDDGADDPLRDYTQSTEAEPALDDLPEPE